MSNKNILTVNNLTVQIVEEKKIILENFSLIVKSGEHHVLMGPNGSGKSTLAYVLMGHPDYEVIDGEILWEGENCLEWNPEERSLRGLFLSFQQPIEIPGLVVGKFLHRIAEVHAKRHNQNFSSKQFLQDLKKNLSDLGIENNFINRSLNVAFSGGEKKRMEMLQLLILKPKLAILDEIDSGLDIDALKTISQLFHKMKELNMSSIIITHYQRILHYLSAEFVHIIKAGKIVQTGQSDLMKMIEEKGYTQL